jgi:gliding motility-associated-like protein
VNKDLFERNIGETLRKSEARPPEDAWDFIKAHIPSASTTPPFKFPVWAVAIVSSALLGSMAIVGGPQLASSEAKTGKSFEVVAEKVEAVSYSSETEKSFSSIGQMSVNIEAEPVVASNESAEEAAAEENPEVFETSQTNVDPVKLVMSNVSEPQFLAEAPTEFLENEANDVFEQDQNASDHTEEVEESTAPVDYVKEFQVSGTQECYTPCSLKLLAIGNADEYTWDAGIYGMHDGEEMNIVVDEPKTISIFSTAKYADGSERSINHNVVIKPGSQLFVPNSFTPNGDGINDEYQVEGTGIEEFSMTIINSKGRVVHQATDMQQSWRIDGVSMDLETEVFTAIIRARGVDGKDYSENVRLIINP